MSLVFLSESTIKVLPPSFREPIILMNSLVLGCSRSHSLTTIRFPSRRRSEIAEHMARFLIFFGKLYDQSRGCGPCTLPPALQRGERKLAIRARSFPVYFQTI